MVKLANSQAGNLQIYKLLSTTQLFSNNMNCKVKMKNKDPSLLFTTAKNSIVVLINITICYIFSSHKSTVEMSVFAQKKSRSNLEAIK